MTTALLSAGILLLFGIGLRSIVPGLRTAHIPASVVGGLLGLVVATTLRSTELQTFVTADVVSQWRSWPGFLIAVVFGGMLLSPRSADTTTTSSSGVAREGLMVWIIGVGQTAIGCLLVWLLLGPVFGTPPQLAVLIETGFIGGHGTAASMGATLASETIGIDDGLALGTLMATIGLIYGVVSGVVWINLGIARGWLATPESIDEPLNPLESDDAASNFDNVEDRAADIDPWLLQAIYLVIALSIGEFLQWLAAVGSERIGLGSIISSLPLFIFTLAGGLILRWILQSAGVGSSINKEVLDRQTGIAMDVLVVAAIASLDLVGVIAQLPVVLAMSIGGAIWTAICLLVLARHILPQQHWFELGLLNYGMSTGTTATGFVLLRMVDPHLRTAAAQEYALATPMSSPFIGGGMITFALPLVILGRIPIGWVAVTLSIVVAVFILLGYRTNNRGT